MVTHERPKIDRIACPWLIARHIDAEPDFLFVPADRVSAVAAQTGAILYDIPGVELSHVGERCSFDAFLAKYRLNDPILSQLAVVVRGADTGHLELAPRPRACWRYPLDYRPAFRTTTRCSATA